MIGELSLPETEDGLRRVQKIMTREFSVIMHVIEEINSYYNLFSLARDQDEQAIDELTDSKLEVANQIKLLVDPIPYVMTYSFQSLRTLNRVTF